MSGRISPARVILPVGIGTALSLLGDSTLYTVLPTHTAEAGISLTAVGALLGANRLVRLLTNPVSGYLFDRGPQHRLFVFSLALGALSTLLCALVSGFWPFLAARMIWGLSWSGIWVGGASILLAASSPADRGKWLGAVQVWFFAGTAGGSLLGGWFTDLLGYRTALAVLAGLSAVGVFTAAFALPGIDHRPRFPAASPVAPRGKGPSRAEMQNNRLELAVAALVEGVNRLVLSGILAAILSLLVRDRLASLVVLVGVSTLTGILNLGRTAASTASAVTLGRLSDALRDRWLVMAISLASGGAGLHLLAYGQPLPFALGLLLSAVAVGGIPVITRSLAGDISRQGNRGQTVGIIQTAGDLGSAIGPPLAFLLLPRIGPAPLFNASAGAYALCILLVFLARRRWALRVSETDG